MLIAFFAGILTGFVAALFGVGGGVLAIPIMVFVLGLPPPKAVGTNSVIIVISTLTSAFFHWKQGTLRKEGFFLGLGGLLGSLLGNWLFFYVTALGLTRRVLGISFMIIGIMMWVGNFRSRREIPKKVTLFLLGVGIGTFAALVGMSGGVLLNPTLVLLGVDVKVAIGMSVTALPIITVASAVPKILAGYADLGTAAAFAPGIVLGTKLGAATMKGMRSNTLRRLFALFMFLVGIKFLT
ncbi:MAG: sulfite exporter TauE/SafE family protein [Crenarchaeota archaeon]|nr:sulfite exporter TauE/SafE family protein [Thermoproteota archaeon]